MSVILAAVLAALLVGTDQILKLLAIRFLAPKFCVTLIPGVLQLRYVENTGAIFGSFSAHTAVLTVVSVVLLAVTAFFLVTKKSGSKLVDFCLVLMISGGIGNIIDRIRLHYVVDYIEPLFVNFAVFNFADCLITVGAFSLVLYLLVDLFRDNKKRAGGAAPAVSCVATEGESHEDA